MGELIFYCTAKAGPIISGVYIGGMQINNIPTIAFNHSYRYGLIGEVNFDTVMVVNIFSKMSVVLSRILVSYFIF